MSKNTPVNKTSSSSKKKVVAVPEFVIIKLQILFNNTRVDITDVNGNLYIWKSSGSVGFKNSKKNSQNPGKTGRS